MLSTSMTISAGSKTSASNDITNCRRELDTINVSFQNRLNRASYNSKFRRNSCNLYYYSREISKYSCLWPFRVFHGRKRVRP